MGKIELGDWFEEFRIIDNERMWLYSDYNNRLLHNVILYNYQKGKIMARYYPFEKNGSQGKAISAFHAETVINLSDKPFPSDKNPDGLLHEDDNPVIFIRELH